MKPSIALAVLAATLTACMGELPPPPNLSVTSPKRGLVQSDAGQVVVTGNVQPGPDGSPVSRVVVNNQQASLGSDGSFTVTVPVPAGAMLLRTVAYSQEGGEAIDARAVHVGELRPVGSRIDRAISASLSTEALALISAKASEMLNATDFSALVPPMSFGDSLANVKLTVNQLAIADATIGLVPVDNGLKIHLEIDGLTVGAKAAYAGTLVPDGSTSVNVTADKITIDGTLVVTPDGMGFKTTIASPTVATKALKLQASGIVGDIIDLLQSNLSSTVQKLATRGAEAGLQPGINAALGAIPTGPQSIDVLGKTLVLDGSASEIKFTTAGAFASLNLGARIAGSEKSPGYIYTPNGAPAMGEGQDLELAISDDLLNDMLAQVHALGILDLHLAEDFGVFDVIDIKATLPPMITANTGDGKVRLVLGDMIATVSNDGKTLVRAAVNASVDVAIGRGKTPTEVALQFGKIQLIANLLDDPQTPSEIGVDELAGAASAGVSLQIDSLKDVLVTVPVPAIAGITLDGVSLHGEQGYVVAGGDIH